jgi:hypothetical protein
MIHRLAAVAAASVLASAGAAAAQEVRSQVVEDQFAQAIELEAGMTRQASFRGGLPQGGSVVFAAMLRGGANYMIVGACDQSCTDVDLMVRDAAGGEAGSDFLDDDVPVVGIEGAREGLYSFELSAAACGADLCETGVEVYELP